MLKRRGDKEFIKSFQPKLFSEMYDTFNISAFKELISKEDRPRGWLLIGNRGCGKTTLAKIFSKWLNCSNLKDGEPCLVCDSCKQIELGCTDVSLINMADKRTLEDARDIIGGLSYSPMTLKNKVVILDEVHRMRDEAQEVLLAEMDRMGKNVYLILCTMTPRELVQALVDRCGGKFIFSSLPFDQGINFIKEVFEIEGKKFDYEIAEKVLEASNGSPRDIVSKIQAYFSGCNIVDIADEEDVNIKDIAQKIINGKDIFKDLPKLTYIKDKKFEEFRIGLASYFRACLINASYSEKDKFADILSYLLEPLYTSDSYNKLSLQLYKCLKITKK
jgi:DNA polymerase III gamma/tau subunit